MRDISFYCSRQNLQAGYLLPWYLYEGCETDSIEMAGAEMIGLFLTSLCN